MLSNRFNKRKKIEFRKALLCLGQKPVMQNGIIKITHLVPVIQHYVAIIITSINNYYLD